MWSTSVAQPYLISRSLASVDIRRKSLFRLDASSKLLYRDSDIIWGIGFDGPTVCNIALALAQLRIRLRTLRVMDTELLLCCDDGTMMVPILLMKLMITGVSMGRMEGSYLIELSFLDRVEVSGNLAVIVHQKLDAA